MWGCANRTPKDDEEATHHYRITELPQLVKDRRAIHTIDLDGSLLIVPPDGSPLTLKIEHWHMRNLDSDDNSHARYEVDIALSKFGKTVFALKGNLDDSATYHQKDNDLSNGEVRAARAFIFAMRQRIFDVLRGIPPREVRRFSLSESGMYNGAAFHLQYLSTILLYRSLQGF